MAVVPKARVLSNEQIEQAYPDEWVLIEVTREHFRTARLWGRVLAHSEDRGAMTEVIHAARREDPDIQLAVHYTGPGLDPNFDGAIIL